MADDDKKGIAELASAPVVVRPPAYAPPPSPDMSDWTPEQWSSSGRAYAPPPEGPREEPYAPPPAPGEEPYAPPAYYVNPADGPAGPGGRGPVAVAPVVRHVRAHLDSALRYYAPPPQGPPAAAPVQMVRPPPAPAPMVAAGPAPSPAPVATVAPRPDPRAVERYLASLAPRR